MKRHLLVGLAAVFYGCASAEPDGAGDTDLEMKETATAEIPEHYYHQTHVPPMTSDQSKEVKRYQHYNVAGKLAEKTLLYAKAQGVTTVIDLRPITEADDAEKRQAHDLKLDYIHVAVAADGQFSSSIYEKLATVLSTEEEKENRQFLIHHDEIDQAAAWLAIYIAMRSSLNTDTALSIADGVGLESPVTRKQLESFLDGPQEDPVDESTPIDKDPEQSK